MKKLISAAAFICVSVSANPLFSSGILLEDDVSFGGKCGSIAIEGTAYRHIDSTFHPMGVTITVSGKTVFDPDDPNLPVPIERMSIDCIGRHENSVLVLAINRGGNNEESLNTWFYILDAKTGAIIAPKDIKSEKALCNAKCADKVLGSEVASAIEAERDR